MASNFLSYEETIPLITSSLFKNVHIFNKEETQELIESLPDVPYGEMPPGLSSPSEAADTKKQEHPLSSKEKNGQNKYA